MSLEPLTVGVGDLANLKFEVEHSEGEMIEVHITTFENGDNGLGVDLETAQKVGSCIIHRDEIEQLFAWLGAFLHTYKAKP